MMRFALAAALVIVCGSVLAQGAIDPYDFDHCLSDRHCIDESRQEISKLDCVDIQASSRLGHGSIELAKQIADACLSEYLKAYHPEYTLNDVRVAEANAPGGVYTDLTGKIPGIGDALVLTLKAEEDFDCHSTHPGGEQMICNAPLDKDQEYMEEYWQSAKNDEFSGKTRAEFNEFWHGQIRNDTERRLKLAEIYRILQKNR